MSRPRQASGPRTGSGPRAPAGARRSRGRSGLARASYEPVPAEPPREPGAVATAAAADADAAAAEAARGLSPLQQLLAALDAFLRDPRLADALRAGLRNVAAGVRGMGAAAKRLAIALWAIKLPIPRWLLLALLALALPLALLALLLGSDDERSASDQPPAAPAQGGGGFSLPGVGMPDVRADPDRVPQVRVALVLDRTYTPQQLRRELRTLGDWLAENHAPGTRLSLIDATTGQASRPLRAADLAAASPLLRPRPNTRVAIRSAFKSQKRRRLLVTVGSRVAPPGRTTTVRVGTGGAGAGAGSSTPLRRGGRSRVTVDERRPNALAASVARSIMGVSGQREPR
ncbi:MAG TPA: hypothetical protein VNA28_02855 [Solirubrobacteraceae bacterium]|nr:hypothetical protein [Solirubrobacteraceae bacterium]